MTSLADLKSDKRNARRRTDRSATLIGESLKRYGAARSIVIDEDNTVLAGNGTLEQAQAAGISNVRIIEADGDELIAVRRSNLSDADKVGLAIADNRTSDLSDWDAEMLRQLDAEYDLSPWFDEDELSTVEEADLPDMPEEDPLTCYMKFVLSWDQESVVKAALDRSSKMFHGVDENNPNENGNRLANLCDWFLKHHD